jgi:DNA-binding PadR family transcriptional regulator
MRSKRFRGPSGPAFAHAGHGHGFGHMAMAARHGFGGPPFGGPPFGGRRGPRARRGDVRAAILLLLDEDPRNGYTLMQEIEERSGGAWRPSPGAVYPALQQLEDEGLVEPQEGGGRKVLHLTDEGRAYVEENRKRLGSPWEEAAGGLSEAMASLGGEMRQTGAAVMQVMHSGSDEQRSAVREILANARKAIYRILAEDEPSKPDQV